MRTSPNDISNQEIMEELRKLSTANVETLEAVYELSKHADVRFNGLEGRMDNMETEMGRMKAVMVTKDYLDDKLADLHSNIIQHTRKEIQKALG